MKTSEYFIVAGVSILAVYIANRFLGNITVYTTGTSGAKAVL
jgi:hypothetical protein